jgi:hypothetical protein
LGQDHPKVATDLNNLALLFQTTDRLDEAEPLMRRTVEVLLKFTAATGHPRLKTALGNYIDLLMAMGHTEEQAHKKISALLTAHGVSMTDRDEENPAVPQA